MKKYVVSNIDYDVDDDTNIDELPKTLIIVVPNGEEPYEYIGNKISDITGFLHNGFSINLKQ